MQQPKILSKNQQQQQQKKPQTFKSVTEHWKIYIIKFNVSISIFF